ncbi:MAG: aldo/keto reductase [Kutzneria sp.]|nr:aldo/keto reductase [Kutzneria sp.]
MQYRKLGTSGLTVSRMTFGAMTFGDHDFRGFKASVDQSTADRMVGVAMDAGLTTFDTADFYAGGQSEVILGKALATAGRRDHAVVATKVGLPLSDDPNDGGLSHRHVVGGVEACLRRLGTDYIDLLQIHAADFSTPLEETLRALDSLVHRGLVRYLGWSNLPAWYAAKAQGLQAGNGWAPFVSAQIYYNLLARDVESEVLPFVRDAGLGTFIWSPLAGGFLSGKYTRDDPTGGGGRRASFGFPPIDVERGYDLVDVLRRVADEQGITPAQAALGWLLAKQDVTSVIVGVSRMEQLEANLAGADVVLPAETVTALDAACPLAPTYPQYMYTIRPGQDT